MRSIIPILAKYNVSPNTVSLIALALSLLIPVFTYLYGVVGFLILISVSGFFDIIDGMLARYLDKVSKTGSLLDSLGDRLSDSMYLLGLYILGVDLLLIYIGLISTFMISYIRSKGESLGLNIEGVGLMERGERILYIVFIAILSSFIDSYYINILFLIYIALTIATVIERAIYIMRNLH